MTAFSQQQKNIQLVSPNGKLSVVVGVAASKKVYYSVYYNKDKILDSSSLGILLEDDPAYIYFSGVRLTGKALKQDQYTSKNIKRFNNVYRYLAYRIELENSDNRVALPLEFQVSDNGVAFRYYIPKKENTPIEVLDELTSYHFTSKTKAFLQPVAVAKSGWEATNPSYEENYVQDAPVGTPEPTHTGWVYPALFHKGDVWIAITESGLDGSYCATRLSAQSSNGNYKVTFPDKKEIISGMNGLLPFSDTSFYSPWRIIAIGSLKEISESTLGTDVAAKAKYPETLCRLGQASWSWINSKDDYIVYDEQKKYIDFAADMHWKYTLVDVNWDTKIGYDKMAELAQYANSKKVGLLLWYNSAGDWNTVKYTPKNKLLTHESRMAEFSRLKSMGIKGVKIDFFGGDGRSVIQYYVDILNDAAQYGLVVNFHGATLPRGWARTYPNLMTTEAVKGFEMITFEQKAADQEASHVAMLPFTRNLFDPMDFTPMNLYKIPTQVQRRTTTCFELATSVLFLSGIQHFAESPEGMAHMPDYVQHFLQTLPTYWDDVKFIDGYPGKYVVIARRSGKKWYVAGINAESQEKTIKLNESFLKNAKVYNLFSDADAPVFVSKNNYQKGSSITMKPNAGFVLVAE
ncbi:MULTISPECIES: glycoside hydrolase family 97 catalytic domain-containing protein [Chitinophagaceae]